MKFSRKLIFALIIFLIISITICYNLNPYRGSISSINNSMDLSAVLTKEQALEDIDYVEKIIKERHLSTASGLSSNITTSIEEEKERINDNITVLEMWQGISRILSKLKDAHTSVKLVCPSDRITNVNFKMENNDLYIIDDSNNKKLVFKINNKDVSVLYEEFLSKFSFENEYNASNSFALYLKSYSGVCFILNEMPEYEIDIETVSSDNKSKIKVEQIKYEENINEISNNDVIDYSIDYEKSSGVLVINSCVMNSEYKNSLRNFFSALKDNNIKNIAIDLRNNTGGNSEVIEEFMRYIDVDKYNTFASIVRYGPYTFETSGKRNNKKYDDFLYKGNIYVLSSNRTFSSGMMFSVTLQDNYIAKVIGEPSGNSPCSYGDVINFSLPNSKLLFTTTYKKFIRPNSEFVCDNAQKMDYSIDEQEALDKFYEIISN